MNYLAHFYLSFDQEALIVGNLLGDFVRGRLTHPRNSRYSTAIKQGVLLHRHIDFFTDTHPIGQACRAAMPPQFAKYKGVVMDMYFDYFLAKNFSDYHKLPLQDFTANVYQILQNYTSILPEESLPLVKSMIHYNWLYNYQFQEGINRSFLGMSKRFSFLKGIELAGEELFANEKTYERFFKDFFPELIGSCEAYLTQ